MITWWQQCKTGDCLPSCALSLDGQARGLEGERHTKAIRFLYFYMICFATVIYEDRKHREVLFLKFHQAFSHTFKTNFKIYITAANILLETNSDSETESNLCLH